MTDTITEAPEVKSKKMVLPKEARQMMVNFLESQEIVNPDAMTDENILKEYNVCVMKMQKSQKSLLSKVSNYEVSSETKGINQYIAANEGMRVTDKDFQMRLFRMNIHHRYLHLFKDAHADLSNKDLWAIVNKSGIDPLKDKSVLHKVRGTELRPKAM